MRQILSSISLFFYFRKYYFIVILLKKIKCKENSENADLKNNICWVWVIKHRFDDSAFRYLSLSHLDFPYNPLLIVANFLFIYFSNIFCILLNKIKKSLLIFWEEFRIIFCLAWLRKKSKMVLKGRFRFVLFFSRLNKTQV